MPNYLKSADSRPGNTKLVFITSQKPHLNKFLLTIEDKEDISKQYYMEVSERKHFYGDYYILKEQVT